MRNIIKALVGNKAKNVAKTKAKKALKKDQSDLEQPAGISPDDVDAGMAPGKKAAFKANQFDKALKRKKIELENVSARLKEESSKGSPMSKSSVDQMLKLSQQKSLLKSSIADMKKRGGPRAEKSEGGKVGKKLKSVSSKISKPLGCGKAQRGFGKGPYKK